MPSIGEISFANFRSEFNDSGEIRMSDFYRGGAFVDATRAVTDYGPVDGPYVQTPESAGRIWAWRFNTAIGVTSGPHVLYWNNSAIKSIFLPGFLLTPFTTTSGNYEYIIDNSFQLSETTVENTGPWSDFRGPSGLVPGPGGLLPQNLEDGYYSVVSRSTGIVTEVGYVWDGVNLGGSTGSLFLITGGFEYSFGSLAETNLDATNEYRFFPIRRRTYSTSTFNDGYRYYRVSRREIITSTINVNTQVPSSGTIGMLNMRGAQNY